MDKRFTDKASGKNTKRAQLQAALEYLRDVDVLVVHSMDRLARNLDDLRKLVPDLTGSRTWLTHSKGVQFGSIRGSARL